MAHFPSFSHPPRLSTVTLGELHKLSRMLHAVAVAAGSLPDNPANPTEVMVFEDIAEPQHDHHGHLAPDAFSTKPRVTLGLRHD